MRNRFTYLQKGLKKVSDLGELWEAETGLPIPLGGIAVRNDLPSDVKQKVGRVVRRSVEEAMNHPAFAMPYVKEHAQEMDDEVCKQHIALYVNEYSVSMGEKGRNAIRAFFDKARSWGSP
jgi:1,4-dihydroxy-6-naphthoate synthase